MEMSLPDELWVAIFSYLPDFNNLRDAALTCLTWFRCAPSACRQVILNETNQHTLPEAIMALESSKFSPRDLNMVAAYSDKYLKKRPPIPPSISMADGAALAEISKCARHLTDKYQEFALQRLTKEQRGLADDRRDWPQPPASPEEPTAAETARFQRALYRFEVYCNLFKDPEVVRFNLDVVNFQRAHFFDYLSPWEMEQLVGVRDYLAAAIIGPPLYALVELRKLEALSKHHCGPRNGQQVVYWTGPVLPPNLERGDCHIKQNQARLLCFGIKFLYKVSITPTTQFYQLLLALPQQPRYNSYNRVGEIYVWFSDAVDECNELSNLELPLDKPVGAWTTEEYREHVRQSLVTQDTDKGPEEAWYWAYQWFPGFENNDLRMTNCRLFGLFFWDSERLKNVNFFTRVDFWWWRWEGGRQPDFDWEVGATNFQRF
ncbi:uncharacterized protein CTRU02_210306 [Colletotrichum truncatum]|uniref:Uncharacterized protein n=1 Tax=Colletotrichum truncatum TaxID=5467 RepID=A0ACC3YUX3_COLTU|nr:uncharacterized protein CTRU02_11520 [Colletotrichum truncatum]KAF6785895.1 hypothetical protein CTRU02_11520 [Colletotrichum truncatum]